MTESRHEEPRWYRHLVPSEAVEAVAARCMELSEDVEAGMIPRATLDHWLAEWADAVRRAAVAATDAEIDVDAVHAEKSADVRPPVAAPAYTLPQPGGHASVREKV